MSSRTASTIGIGLLAGISCLFTAFVITVPIWVVFIGWASFFAAGGGLPGLSRSLVMNLAGVVSATVTLLAMHLFGGGDWAVAGCVVFGAGVLVAIGRFDILSFTPAGFFGFAGTVGTIAATGTSITDAVTFDHPAITAAVALAIGAAFGIASEKLSAMLDGLRPVPVSAASSACDPGDAST